MLNFDWQELIYNDMTDIIEKLKHLDNDKLVDVIKNYRQYGYEDELRSNALSILEERGFTKEQLDLTGNFKNQTFDFAGDLFRAFQKNSKLAMLFYGIVLAASILIPVMSRISESYWFIMVIIRITAFIAYLILLLFAFLNQSLFYKTTGNDYGAEGALMYLLLGMPAYIVMYFYFKSQMKDKMKEIR